MAMETPILIATTSAEEADEARKQVETPNTIEPVESRATAVAAAVPVCLSKATSQQTLKYPGKGGVQVGGSAWDTESFIRVFG
ncbi:hypothetical protein V6N12_058970 [Hibiscus sabdariffa]|uniref:Uncharacterized protein n=1 Tax=Hibiscus sabdariffa TaxID=183260 RepID=A0ABR2ETP9_9ROSI